MVGGGGGRGGGEICLGCFFLGFVYYCGACLRFGGLQGWYPKVLEVAPAGKLVFLFISRPI